MQAGSPDQRSWGRCLAHAICSGWGPALLTRAREAFSQAATGNVHFVNLNNPCKANSRARQNREDNLISIPGISLRGRNTDIKRSLQNEVTMRLAGMRLAGKRDFTQNNVCSPPATRQVLHTRQCRDSGGFTPLPRTYSRCSSSIQGQLHGKCTPGPGASQPLTSYQFGFTEIGRKHVEMFKVVGIGVTFIIFHKRITDQQKIKNKKQCFSTNSLRRGGMEASEVGLILTILYMRS